ncbi:SGNH/GDSL hydrolase family protein [Spirobacillus cienkowskii]|uniref:SGNH/GDSL hydrolase family protein n=1 Tax=Spirobacillus cienkowskii TaxID=495820 RepID=UPI0030D5E3BA
MSKYFICYLFLLFHFSVFSLKNEEFLIPQYEKEKDFYVVCYYYDTDKGLNNKNPQLMLPSKWIFSLGVRKNYYWAINDNTFYSRYTKLTGDVQDGFFIEKKLTYNDVERRCQLAIERGSSLSITKPTYKLYDFKASSGNLNGYEYPIQFSYQTKSHSKIKKIVLFGDSLSDTGNLKRWTKVFPYYPFFYGRFSDGLIWVDFLSHLTHIPILNFSFGGAKTEGVNDDYIKELPKSYVITSGRNLVTGSSKLYVEKYLNSYLTNNNYLTKNQFITSPEEVLYIFWVGANDFMEKFEKYARGEKFFENPDDHGRANFVAYRAAQNIIEQAEMVIKKGGKNFVIFNLPDLGKSPVVLTGNYKNNTTDINDRIEFSIKLTDVTKRFNNYLRLQISKLQEKYSNSIFVKEIDMYSNFEKIMNNYDVYSDDIFDYGFDSLNSNIPIPGLQNKYVQVHCYNQGYTHLLFSDSGGDIVKKFWKYNKCVNAHGSKDKVAIFWNSPHPTSYTHCWIAHSLQKKLLEFDLLAVKAIDMDKHKSYCLENYLN